TWDQHEVRFCPAGPSDVHVHWLMNGHSLDTPVKEHRRPLGQRVVLVSSWLRGGPLIRDARYHCVAEASTGKVDKVTWFYSTDENIPSRDLSQWRGALSEHEQLLKRWEKAWVGPCSECGKEVYDSNYLTYYTCTSLYLQCMFELREV
uniref:Uncharacterized protein n=1 Tax=Kryptolebias marmoratus TaxID=37003 RepID=A0A3Q3G738_KRYMA